MRQLMRQLMRRLMRRLMRQLMRRLMRRLMRVVCHIRLRLHLASSPHRFESLAKACSKHPRRCAKRQYCCCSGCCAKRRHSHKTGCTMCNKKVMAMRPKRVHKNDEAGVRTFTVHVLGRHCIVPDFEEAGLKEPKYVLRQSLANFVKHHQPSMTNNKKMHGSVRTRYIALDVRKKNTHTHALVRIGDDPRCYQPLHVLRIPVCTCSHSTALKQRKNQR